MATKTATPKVSPARASKSHADGEKPTGQAKKQRKQGPKASEGVEVREFAVIETGGKQYVVSVGDTLEVERLRGDLSEGDKIEFDKVLMVDNGKDATIGTPYIDGAKVQATYQGEKKGKKLNIIRFKAKSNRDRNVGHRQKYSKITIDALK